MEDFLKMDVFFVATTAVVVILGVLSIVALFYLIKIFHNIDRVMKNVGDESDEIRTDLKILREKVRDEGMRVKHILDFVRGITARKTKTRTRHKSEASDQV